MEKVDIAIVGAGVIGLAVARELSLSYKDILVIEKNPSFGQETSSRNSEVIHAGIYYPKTSLKTNSCIEGNKLLYEFCLKYLPFIELEDLSADLAGIRPKLQGPGERFRDFIVREESDKGMSRLINLIGIESPGLTASLSLAKRVKKITEKII